MWSERGAGCAHLKHVYQGLCPKQSGLSTARWRLQHTGDHSRRLTPPPSLFPFFFKFNFIVSPLFILPYTIPLDIASILGQQETVVQEYSSTCTVCVYTGQISQYLAARLTFRMLYTSESCRCCHTAPVLSILTHVTSCLPTFTLPERGGGWWEGLGLVVTSKECNTGIKVSV